jgi:hypothetical protein
LSNIGAKAFDKLFAKPMDNFRRAVFAGLFDIVNQMKSPPILSGEKLNLRPAAQFNFLEWKIRPGIIARTSVHLPMLV